LTGDLSRHGLGQVSLRDRSNHARHFACGLDQISDQVVNRSNRVGPTIPDIAQRGALRDLSLLAVVFNKIKKFRTLC
jgi:hypothetical protein